MIRHTSEMIVYHQRRNAQAAKSPKSAAARVRGLNPRDSANPQRVYWPSTCRDAFLFEDGVEDSPLRHELTHEKVQSVGGWMEVPDRPGLGVTIGEAFVKKYLVAESK